MSRTSVSLATGLAVGYLADRVLGDPRRFHPVAGFGQLAAAVEQRGYADSRARGVCFTTVLVGGAVVAGGLTQRCSYSPWARVGVTALSTWAVLGARSLEAEANTVLGLVEQDKLDEARVQLTHLVGRDTSELTPAEIARATIESVAENTSDAVVAPLLWGALAGIPGLWGYRAANTLDAMVGYRSHRYRQFGWASAKLDDVLNYPAARLCGLLTLVVAPGQAPAAWMAWRRDAAAHPSPNAGVVEAAFAGALGFQLGGTNRYGDRVEHRAVMGNGRAPTVADIRRTTCLARRVGTAAALVCAALTVVLRGRARDRR